MPFAYYTRLPPARRRIYDRSDTITTLPLPPGPDAGDLIEAIAAGLAGEQQTAVQRACQKLMDDLVVRFEVPPLRIKVYASRPSGDWGELHGLYLPEEGRRRAAIEVWMRTAQKGRVVARRTFVRTLVHELCHHLDYERFMLEETFHTEGFYKRESHLLLQLAGPPAPRGSSTASAQPQDATVTGTRRARAQSNS